MKKRQLLNWMLFALLAFTFSACDNEPLEGVFITDDGGGTTLEEGQFVAIIDGEPFSATASTGVLNDGTLFITGTNANGDIISLVVSNAGECTYDLSLISNPAQYVLNGEADNPYASSGILGGSGSLQITNFDADEQTVTGTFSFTGVREVVDGSGNTSTETVQVTAGSFTSISFELTSGSGEANACNSGGGGVDPVAAFFALLNGVEFVDITFTAEKITVAGQPMVKLVATAENGATIRIDIPEGLGTGTFQFMDPISDGTKLIAIYTNPGGTTYTSDVGSGSITITEFGATTGKLAASFAFVGTDPIDPGNTTEVQITDGSFNIDYIDNSGGVENTFSAVIDAVAYEPTSIAVTQAPFADTTLITVTSIDELNNQSLTISFPVDIEAGAYDMTTQFVDGTEKVGWYNPDIGNSILFASSPGILNILSYELSNGIIEATFAFTAIDPAGNDSTEYAITDGQFTIQIP